MNLSQRTAVGVNPLGVAADTTDHIAYVTGDLTTVRPVVGSAVLMSVIPIRRRDAGDSAREKALGPLFRSAQT